MGEFDDIFGVKSETPASNQQGTGEFDDIFGISAAPKRTVAGTAKDLGITALKGAIGVGEAVQGLADIPTGGRVGKFTEGIGYKPKQAKEILDTYLSPAQQAANKQVEQADGFVDTVGAAVQNPSTILHAGVESLPLMGAGGVAARGLMGALGTKVAVPASAGVAEVLAPKVAPWIAGAFGEGLVGAGSAAEQIRQQTEDGLLTAGQALAGVGSGLGTGAFNLVGGRLAQKFGFADPDTLLAQGLGKVSKEAAEEGEKGVIRRIIEGGISEGVFEEMPQSAQEQVWQNAALGKPLTEGVGSAMGMGMLTGAAMGAGVNMLPQGTPAASTPPPKPEVPPNSPLTRAASMLTAGYATVPEGRVIDRRADPEGWARQEEAAKTRNEQAINRGDVAQDRAKGGAMLKRDIPQADQKLTRQGKEKLARAERDAERQRERAEFEAEYQRYNDPGLTEQEERQSFPATAGMETEDRRREGDWTKQSKAAEDYNRGRNVRGEVDRTAREYDDQLGADFERALIDGGATLPISKAEERAGRFGFPGTTGPMTAKQPESKPNPRQREMDEFELAYNPDARASLMGKTMATDDKGRAEWLRQEKKALTKNKVRNFQDAQTRAQAINEQKRREQAEAEEARKRATDPLYDAKQRFQESYDAAGTIPPVDYPSDQAAKEFEQKVRGQQKDRQHREWVQAYRRKQAENKALAEDETIPPEVRKQAAKEAEDIVTADPVYGHMAEAKRRGKLNLEAFGQDYDKDTIRQIIRRYPGIFSQVGTVQPDDFASEMGYASLDDMVRRFSEARTKTELTAQIIRERTGEWQQAEDAKQADDEFFAAKAERSDGGARWKGEPGGYQGRPLRTRFPAHEEEIAYMEDLIRRRPDNFTDDDLDHWTYTAEQQGRLRKALREAQQGDSSGSRMSDNTEQEQGQGDTVASDATTPADAAAGLSGPLNGIPKVGQPAGDRVLADTKIFGDSANAEAIVSEGFESFNRDVQHVILSKVAAAIHDEKIFNSVVKSIPIDVMNDLVGRKLSSNMLLDNQAVLGNRLSVPGDKPVPKPVARFINALASSIEVISARLGAEESRLPPSSLPAKSNSAADADPQRGGDTGPATERPLWGSDPAGVPGELDPTSGTSKLDDGHVVISLNGGIDSINTTPSEAQKQAGVYKKGHFRLYGLDISIENPAGSTRSGVDPDGKRWEVPIRDHYGYIKGTVGKDKDHLDVFIPEGFIPGDEDTVYIVNQIDPKTGKFDEHKIVFGSQDEAAARTTYLRNYDKTGPSRIGSITEMPLDEFKGWLDSGDTTKPASPVRGSDSAKDETQAELPRTDETQAGAGGAGSEPFTVIDHGDGRASIKVGRKYINNFGGKFSLGGKNTAYTFNTSVIQPKAVYRAAMEAMETQKQAHTTPNTTSTSDLPGVGTETAPSPGEASLPPAAQPSASKATPEKPETEQLVRWQNAVNAYVNGEDAANARTDTIDRALQNGLVKPGEAVAFAEWLVGQGGRAGLVDHARARQTASAAPAGKRPAQYGQANKVFTAGAAEKARAILRAKLKNQLSSGLDPELMQAGITLAGYHIEAGARKFADYARAMIADLGDGIKPYLRSLYEGVRYYPGMPANEMSAAAEIDGIDVDALSAEAQDTDREQPTNEDANVAQLSGNTDLERDSQDAGTQDGVGQEGVQPERGTDGRTGQPGVRGAEGGQGVDGGVPGVSRSEAAPVGERGDLSPYSADGQSESAASPAGSDDGQRGGDLGLGGPGVEHVSATAVRKAASVRSALEGRVEAQKKAARLNVQPSSRENISDTLPLLHKGQQDDVHFAEKRFSQPDGYGVLFTNGTGTGKTFSALGIIKRLEMQGKKDILVIAPDNIIIDAWTKAAGLFDLELNRLADTKDSGSGITVTTYANFSSNDALAKRNWDLIVADESHQLGMNQSGEATKAINALWAVAMHPRGVFDRTRMLNAELYAEIQEQSKIAKESKSDKDQKKLNALWTKYQAKIDETRAQVEASQGETRPRVVMLSATPFAYEKNIDIAEGFLFDYGPEDTSGGYNSGSAYDRFMMQHFGYSMRYNKLTRPDKEVNSGLMQRQFNSWLKKQGVLSSRVLDVDFDYDRKFILAESAIGQKIDEGMEFLWNNKRYRALSELMRKRFDYLSQRYLLEAIKAKEVIPIIKEHLALGRKVVVFHDYIKGGGFHPFDFSGQYGNTTRVDYGEGAVIESIGDLARAFAAERPDLVNLPIRNMLSPITTLSKAFPDLMVVNGQTVTKKEAQANVNAFNDDNTGPAVLLVQSDKDKGWSGHDTSGKHQRVLINLGLPTRPTRAIQQEGRIYRVGQASDAIIRYVNTGTNWERWAFASTIAQRASTAENLAMGEEARALMDSFVQAFEESDTYSPGHENEGKGGKERDAAANAALTEWDRATTMYFSQQKKTARTKAREGLDYFATPEPLGLKMVEWADVQGGEKVLEPSAGHGAIARWFPDNVEKTVVEPSSELASRLKMVTDGRLVQDTFENLDVVNKFDAIVMNPPFGTAGKTAGDHIEKAIKHLRDGGRIVALIPRGASMDKRLDKILYGEDAKGKPLHPDVYLVASYILPTAVFERAGTSVATRVVILDKHTDKETAAKIQQQGERDYSDEQTIKDFFARIENSSARERVPVKAAAAPDAAAAVPRKDGEQVVEYTTKKGKVLRGVVRQITKAKAQEIDPYTFKLNGGFFIREKYLQADEDASQGTATGEENITYAVSEPSGDGGQTAGVVRDRAGAGVRAGGGQQLDLFTGATVPNLHQRRAKRSVFAQVKHAAAGTFTFSGGPVGTMAEIAGIASPIMDGAQESNLLVMLDENNMPVAVLKHSVGGKASGPIDPGIVLGVAHSIKAAKTIWSVHNHPSGMAVLSPADRAVATLLADATKGTGIEFAGMVAVTPGGRFTGAHYRDGEVVGGDFFGDAIADKDARVRGLTRKIKKLSDQPAVTNDNDISLWMRDNAPGQSGVLLLDNRNRPAAFVPMATATMAKLRTGEKGTGASELLAAAEQVNATALVPISTDRGKAGEDAARNIAVFAHAHTFTVLDALVDGQSARDLVRETVDDHKWRGGAKSAASAFFSKGEAVPAGARADIPGELTQAFGKLRARVLMQKITVLESQEEAKSLVARLGGKLSAAWHGSPHEFDEFRMSAVGTGEGAQAYGHGLYFAGQREVAEHYKKTLSAGKVPDVEAIALSHNVGPISREMRIEIIRQSRDPNPDESKVAKQLWYANIEARDWPLGRLAAIIKDFRTAKQGRLYKVELAPQADEYLLWDRPMSEQSEKVRKALEAAGWGERAFYSVRNGEGESVSSQFARSERDAIAKYGSMSQVDTEGYSAEKVDDYGGNDDGRELYGDISRKFSPKVDESGMSGWTSIQPVENDRAASEYLHSLGIRGIKYLDGSSRSKGEGAYNYVIFDEKDVEITAKFSKDGAIQGIYANGKTYLVADGIAKNQAVPVLLHELGEHAAQLGFAGDREYQGILRSLEKRAEAQNATGKAIRAAMTRVPEDTLPEHYWSEVAAYLVENKANSEIGIVKRILNFFKLWLYKAGAINADRLTPEDLVLFARAATLAHTGATYGEGVRQSVRDLFKPVDTNSAAFREWARGSVVRDIQYHWTDAEFDAFDMEESGGMVHFGTKQAASDRAGGHDGIGYDIEEDDGEFWVYADAGPNDGEGVGPFKTESEAKKYIKTQPKRIAPIAVYLNIKNPLRVPDFGVWTLDGVRTYLYNENVINKRDADKVWKAWQNSSKDGYEALRLVLEKKGYDGFVYENEQEDPGSDSYVVLSPTQIKSATENTGAFSLTDPRIRYSKRFEADEAEAVAERQRVLGDQTKRLLDSIAKKGLTGTAEQQLFATMAEGLDIVDTADADLKTKAWDWFKSLPKAAARKSLGALTLRQLRDVFAKNIPQMDTFYEASRAIAADANRVMTAADQIYNQWARLDKKNAKAMSEVMIRSTIAGVNPDVAKFEPRANLKRLHAGIDRNLARAAEIRAKGDAATADEKVERLQAEAGARSKAARIQNEVKRRSELEKLATMYQGLSKEAKDVYQSVRKQYTDNLTALFDALKERVERQIKDPEQRKSAIDAIRLRYDKFIKEGPYFPLSRFGDYIAIAEMDGGARREVRTFDSMAERTRYTRARRAEGWTVQEKTKKEYNRETQGASGTFFEGVIKILNESEGLDAAERKSIIDEVNQHFIKSMPDLSHRKHFVHRRKVEGYSRDQMRAFADNMQHAAHHIARIRHADKMTAAVESVLAESRMLDKDANGDAFVDLHNELVKRLEIMNNPNISPATQALTSFGFLMNIGPSIASALVNISQTPLVAFPILANRFKGLGSITAMTALGKASADYFTSKPSLASGPSLVDNKRLPQEERDMIRALIDDGTIDVTQAHSLAQAAGSDYLNLARTKYGHIGARAMRLVAYPFHVAELANRKITALAAYRMARKSGMGHGEAVAATREAVLDSHFDYSQSNRARWMEGNVRRVLLLFKQYSQQMTWLLGRSFHQAAKGETKEVRQAAARQLGMILAGHFMVAGAMGLPVLGGMVGALSFLGNLAGDDDEPKDLEVSLRNFLADTFGAAGGDAVMNGPWRMLPGLGQLDMANRMSLGDLWFRAPNREMEGRDQFNQYVNLILGPVANNAANVFMGANSMANGEVWRGVEMMLPKAIKDGMKAVRYSTEGVKNWKNDTLLEDLGAVELFGQALGFTPARVSEMYAGANAVKNYETRIERRRKVLMNQWVNAVRKQDAEGARDAMVEITAFNAKNPIFRIDYRRNLVPSLRNRMRVQSQTKEGVYVPATRDEIREVGRFANI